MNFILFRVYFKNLSYTHSYTLSYTKENEASPGPGPGSKYLHIYMSRHIKIFDIKRKGLYYIDMNTPDNEEKYGKLNAADFEDYVSVGTTVENLCKIFMVTKKQMEKWCFETYHIDFNTAYSFLLQRALAEYKKTLLLLANNGNATAINTMNQVVLNMSNQSDVRVSVVASVPKEKEEDENDG